ncbi:MAG: type II toxin-antitoxin system MqsR family toxin [Muribaculaceae bacterium]|nr:type II toxin-antitoxin system MqsR family toxin [Muribaculaceae bacterium]
MDENNITLEDVNRFLEQFRVKASVFGIIYRIRDKNENTLFKLGISAVMREKIVLSLDGIDFSHTTLGDAFDEGDLLWVFGKDYKGTELYIKITIINQGRCLCVSFHEAEHPIVYPFKRKED